MALQIIGLLFGAMHRLGAHHGREEILKESKKYGDLILKETAFIQESWYTESHMVDNRKGLASIKREINTSNECQREVLYSREFDESFTAELSLSGSFVGFKSQIQSALRERYALTEGEKRTRSESVVCEVSPGEFAKLCVEWKKIWQVGRFEASTTEAEITQFKVLQDISFDIRRA